MNWHQSAPDFLGSTGEAWDITTDGRAWLRKHNKWRPDFEAGLMEIVAHVPLASPGWSWYYVASIHLRPIEGVKLAHRQFLAATHEMMIVAIDPALGDPPKYPFRYLTPHNVAAQVVCAEDEVFIEAVKLGVEAVVNGTMGIEPPFGPKSFSDQWAKALQDTIEHLVTGGHA